MLRPALFKKDLGHDGRESSFQIARVQIIADARGVSLRVHTERLELSAPAMRALHSVERWRVDGITPMLSQKNPPQFSVDRQRRPGVFTASFYVDVYLPLNNPIDVSLVPYREVEFTEEITSDTPPPKEPDQPDPSKDVETYLRTFNTLDLEEEI